MIIFPDILFNIIPYILNNCTIENTGMRKRKISSDANQYGNVDFKQSLKLVLCHYKHSRLLLSAMLSPIYRNIWTMNIIFMKSFHILSLLSK